MKKNKKKERLVIFMRKKIKVVTTFSGIGMQERGIENSGCFDVEVIGTSDIDKNAILSYAAMHNGLTPELVKEYKEYPTKEEMVKELFEKNIGYDFVKKKAYDMIGTESQEKKMTQN